MEVYVIRHGESLCNLLKQKTGQIDAPLTEKGYEDARKAGEKLKGIQFDRVFSSDLTRAAETARTALPGVEPEKLVLLREYDFGTVGGHTEEECVALFGETCLRHFKEGDYRPYGGECNEDVHERAAEFLHSLETLDCERVAVFCHGGIIRRMVDVVLDTILPKRKILIDNGSVTVFRLKDGRWQLKQLNG